VSFGTVTEFENKIAEYFGSKYAVATDCCTHAIELCLRYTEVPFLEVPTRTYISIPFLAKKLGIELKWKDEEWNDYYYLGDTNIIDAAVLWRKNSYINKTFMCLSFQFQKHLNLGRGGMILTNDKEAAIELKKMSYDGRNPDTPWREQNIETVGYHYYMTPEIATIGLKKLPEAMTTTPRKWVITDWPDLRKMGIFQAKN
jgi:dTDP-4-amino-4,6-dideoxygalactose transaminase